MLAINFFVRVLNIAMQVFAVVEKLRHGPCPGGEWPLLLAAFRWALQSTHGLAWSTESGDVTDLALGLFYFLPSFLFQFRIVVCCVELTFFFFFSLAWGVAVDRLEGMLVKTGTADLV